MAAYFDTSNDKVRQSLAETILWCTHRQRTGAPLPHDRIRERFKLMDQATELMRQALVGEEWDLATLDRVQKNRDYKRGRELLSEAERTLPISLAGHLRSPELRPESLPDRKPVCSATEDAVHSLAAKRASLISTLGRAAKDAPAAAGRLLVYWPNENLADGAAEYASFGFFDADNTPPWDTWVAFSGKALLSWVPGELVDLVSKGIEANPEACIGWYE